jgi:hypothetical protein
MNVLQHSKSYAQMSKDENDALRKNSFGPDSGLIEGIVNPPGIFRFRCPGNK